MPLLLEPQIEILPGYRLLDRLGSGGFGEVWKAEAPGGLLKAVKIVFGELTGPSSSSVHRAEQELNALKRVQAVRHPFLLSIERYDVVEGRLVIVMELADCNLWDRYAEYRKRRQAGIPRDDLIRYLQEAAEVLDLMNAQHQLQHLDIKPQNLFLVHDHVKVADFGLVRDFTVVKADNNEGGVTPVYAAPETFDGQISAYCDQYSLAIVYQELLTGKRPFPASNMQQLITQHLQAAPDLSSLPPGDRAAVARALNKRPEDRHPTCLAFVRALQTGGAIAAPDAKVTVQQSRKRIAEDISVAASWAETPATMVKVRFDEDLPNAGTPSTLIAPEAAEGDGVLFPALIIAIGRTGLEILLRTRLALLERYSSLNRLPHIRYMFIDTDPETTESAIQVDGPCPLDPDEVFAARLNRPGHYLKPRRNGRSLIEGWFDPQMLYRIKAGNPLTQGMRSLGRLAFLDHYLELEQKIGRELEACIGADALDQTEAQTGETLRSNRPRVYVATCLGGGTGGGMFIDVAYLVRQRLKYLGYQRPDVQGLLMLPPSTGAQVKTLTLGNTYAALAELNHFSKPGVPFSTTADDREVTLPDPSAPFSRFVLLPLRSPQPHAPEFAGVQSAAEFLWRDLITPFGRAADECRTEVRSLPGVTPESPTVAGQTFGLFALTWPRRILQERTARWLCHAILQQWLAREHSAIRIPVQKWVHDQWQEANLAPENVLSLFRTHCEQALGQPFTRLLSDATAPLIPKSRWSRSTYDPSTIWQTLSRLHQVLGQPGDLESGRTQGQFENLLANAAESLRTDWSARFGRLALCLLDQPDYRMSGAEEAQRFLQNSMDVIVRELESRSSNTAALMDAAYQQLEHLLATDVKRKATAEVAECLRSYVLARFEWLLERNTLHVYSHLRDQVQDAGQELEHCRQRLTDLQRQFHPGTPPRTDPGALLPDGCESIEEAVELYLQSIQQEELHSLDLRMQTTLEQQFTGLRHICLMANDQIWSVKASILQIARSFIHSRLESADVAAMFLARNSGAETAQRLIARAFAESESGLDAPDAPTDSVQLLAVPISDSTEEFLKLVGQSLPNSQLSVTSSPDDIIFYREQVTVPMKRLPHIGPASRQAYEQMKDQQFPPHTRHDIRQWYDPGLE
jgi:serine/threonine protein kinase